VTAVFVVPVTVAVNCCVAPGATCAIRGATVTEMLCVGWEEDGVAVVGLEPDPPPHDAARKGRTDSANALTTAPNARGIIEFSRQFRGYGAQQAPLRV
jgi:hypothetical protein